MVRSKSGYDIITVGSATRDVFIQSPVEAVVKHGGQFPRREFPDGAAECFPLGGKIEIPAPVYTTGGGAANAAVTFVRQGFKTAALVVIGKDEEGSAVLRELEEEKVRALPIFDAKKQTAYSVILLSPSGERTIFNYRGASEDMKKNNVPFSKLGACVAYIVPGRIEVSVISAITAHLKKQGAIIAMNPSRHYLEMGAKKLAPMLKHLDIIQVNREEASLLTGIDYRDEKRMFKRFDELVSGLAVMTDGRNGVFVSDGANMYHAGVYKEKKLIDRTGSGDAFGSGFVAAIAHEGAIHEKSIKEGIRLGSANATSVVEHIGATPGILRTKDLSQSRWKSLTITVQSIH